MPTGIDYLLQLNKDRSREFVRERPQRQRYRREHPTEIGVMECMDGRVHFPIMTQTPFGIVQSWRNVGGKFDLFHWPRFQTSIKGLWAHAKKNGNPLLWIVSDHFSRSDQHLGCKGHDYDFKRAEAASRELARQFEHVFGGDEHAYVIRVTVETDEDALIFHSDGRGNGLDLGLVDAGMSRDEIHRELGQLYPGMPRFENPHRDMLEDLTEIAVRNKRHVANVRKAQRPITEAEHREWVIGVGQGFDWLHEANTALIVGPFDPDFRRVVKTAGRIVNQNFQRPDFKRSRGIVLVSSIPFRPEEGAVGRRLAELRAMDLAREAEDAIREGVRDIVSHLRRLTVVVNMEDCRLHIIDGD